MDSDEFVQLMELNVNDKREEKEPDDKVTTWSKTMQGTSRVECSDPDGER